MALNKESIYISRKVMFHDGCWGGFEEWHDDYIRKRRVGGWYTMCEEDGVYYYYLIQVVKRYCNRKCYI